MPCTMVLGFSLDAPNVSWFFQLPHRPRHLGSIERRLVTTQSKNSRIGGGRQIRQARRLRAEYPHWLRFDVRQWDLRLGRRTHQNS
ncbi:MAG: hypothetical protein ACRC8K_22845 [Waterburya sp.]